MVERKICSFCGENIEPGTGKMFIKRDGTVLNFCTNKCKKNMMDLKRVPRRTRWTKRFEKAPSVEGKKKIVRKPKKKAEDEEGEKKRPVKSEKGGKKDEE